MVMMKDKNNKPKSETFFNLPIEDRIDFEIEEKEIAKKEEAAKKVFHEWSKNKQKDGN